MFRNSLLASAAALAFMSVAAFAQETAPADPATPPADAEIVDIYTEADAAAVLAARIVALKTVLQLTPDQEKLWQPVEDAIRKIAASSTKRNTERTAAEPPMDFLDVLDRIADSEATRAAELKDFVAASRPLVASLDEAQKRRVPAFLGMIDDPDAAQPPSQLWLFEEEEG